jgi:hypothetical protein
MPRNAWKSQTRVGAHHRGRISVTYSACFHPNPNLPRSGLRDRPLDHAQNARRGNFHCFVRAFHLSICAFLNLRSEYGCAEYVIVASMQRLVLFPFHPLANIGSAVFKLHAIHFAMRKKTHYFAIDHADVFHIQNDVAMVYLAFKKSLQLGYCLLFDPAAQSEYSESSSRRGLNPEKHSTSQAPMTALQSKIQSDVIEH